MDKLTDSNGKLPGFKELERNPRTRKILFLILEEIEEAAPILRRAAQQWAARNILYRVHKNHREYVNRKKGSRKKDGPRNEALGRTLTQTQEKDDERGEAEGERGCIRTIRGGEFSQGSDGKREGGSNGGSEASLPRPSGGEEVEECSPPSPPPRKKRKSRKPARLR